MFIQSNLKYGTPNAKWEKPDKIHITIEFLGEKPKAWLNDLISEIPKHNLPKRFTIRLDRFGLFPSTGSPKIVWIGTDVAGNETLYELSKLVQGITASIGHIHEKRPFSPHITICRSKGKVSPVLRTNIETIVFHPIEFICNDIRLVKSELSSAGSKYSTLASFPLES